MRVTKPEKVVSGRRGGRKKERGQVLVEFGIVAVVFFLFLFGIFDAARLFQSWITVQHAAREGARYGITGRSDCDGPTDTRAACIEWTAKNATTGLNGGGELGADITVAYRAWDYSTYSGAGTVAQLGKPCDQIEVSVSYTHHFVTPLLQAIVPGGVAVTGSQRMTNEPFGACTAGDGVVPATPTP
jgi:Flp pilus assembly protein TadG